ncbi:MAG: TonB-dependent receptor [Methylomonas sp.]|nr:TonB-dependent receptor [Methylomonas sp.]
MSEKLLGRHWPRQAASVLVSAVLVVASAHAESASNQQYNIPAGSLAAALNRLAETSNLLLVYDASITEGLKSKGLSGSFTPEAALQRLLVNSGLVYRLVEDGTVIIEKQKSLPAKSKPVDNQPDKHRRQAPQTKTETLETVTVSDQVTSDTRGIYTVSRTTTATKRDTPIMETPVSIQTVTQQVIQDRKVTRVEKAVENVSGVYTNVGSGGLSDTFNVRGFRSFDIYRNGMRLQAANSTVGKRETANLDRIEVLKGPASLLYGRIETGGMVNMVTKQPLEEAFYAVEQQFASFDTYRTTVDATGPVTEDKSLLYRVNMAYESSDSFRDYVDGQRVFVAPVLTWRISDQDELSFEMEYLGTKSVPDMGTTAIGNRPAAIPRERNLGENGTQSEGDDIVLGYNWKHQFNDKWKLNHRFNAEYTQQSDSMNVLPWGVLPDGNFTAGGASANGNLQRFVFGLRNNRSHTYSSDINLSGHFDTHGIEHAMLFGGDYYDFWNAGEQYDSSMIAVPCDDNPSFSGFPGINMFDPQHRSCGSVAAFDPNIYGFSPGTGDDYEVNQRTFGIYAQDQIKLPYNIHLLGGMRYDWAEADNIDHLYGGVGNGRWGRVKPRAGIVWQPIQQVSLYGNYMENFGVSNSGVVGAGSGGYSAPPEESHQWEAGIKTEWLDGRLTTNLALFQITKSNLSVGCGARCWQTLGKVRNEGLELDVSGELLPGWKMIGSYAYIDSEIIGGANDGNRLSNVPRNGGSLWSTYEIQSGDLQGLKFGAGVVARSQREGAPDNSYQLPGYATVNLLTSYAWKVGNSKLITQLNVDNLLDKTYYLDADDASNMPWAPRINFGMPRSFIGSVRLEF